MERIRSLDWYQRGVMILMAAMVLVFTVLYPMTIAREGYAYHDVILIPQQENGSTVYSGSIQGKQTSFTVSEDKTVEFQYGDKTYGPYTAKEDPTAIPQDSEFEDAMTGIELRKGDEILFRGGVQGEGEYRWLYNEDASLADFEMTAYTSDGTLIDENGNAIDPMEPSISTILDLMDAPELTHKGEWFAWIAGVFLCMITVISILFADELFHLRMIFQVRNAEKTEPSEWELTGRYISWMILPIGAMILFIMGLR